MIISRSGAIATSPLVIILLPLILAHAGVRALARAPLCFPVYKKEAGLILKNWNPPVSHYGLPSIGPRSPPHIIVGV